MRKLQIAMEFMLVFLFVTAIFLVLFAIISSRGSLLFNQEAYSQTQQLAQQIAHSINTAYNGGNGYVSNTILESGFGLNNYNITILKNGEIIVTANEITQKIRSVAFSQARNLYEANVIPANYIRTQNFFGMICVDIACPQTESYPSSLALYTKGVSVARFNGVNGHIVSGSTNLPTGSSPRSMFAWVYLTGNGIGSSTYGSVIQGYGNPSQPTGFSELYILNGKLSFSEGANSYSSSLDVPLGKWSLVGYTYLSGSGSVTLYLNGNSQLLGLNANNPLSTPSGTTSEIGAEGGTANSGYFNGSISNIQVYDSSLTSNQVLQLYGQGIFGNPVLPQDLVAWWKLEGNANDYSGNNNTGIIYGQVLFPTVSESKATVSGSFGNPLQGSIVGFASSLGNASKLLFSSNYTDSNGLAYAFFNQNLTNGPSTINVTVYPGNAKEQKNLTGWWPLVNGFIKTTVLTNVNTLPNAPTIYSPPTKPSVPVIPPNIKYYTPVSIFNYQSQPVSSDSQILVPVNAVAYKNYYTCNLNNAEFFYANGTLMPSWLEGNYTNENTANALCSSSSSHGALINSGTIAYWIKMNPNAPLLLPAVSSTGPGSLTVYLGWSGNVLGPANTLINGITTGEAPQLSCSYPVNTIACDYAQYDNGASIFPFYDNFEGTTLSNKWTVSSSPSPVVDNGINITNQFQPYGGQTFSTSVFTDPYVLDVNAKVETTSPNTGLYIYWNMDQSSNSGNVWYLNAAGSSYNVSCSDFVGYGTIDSYLAPAIYYGSGLAYNELQPRVYSVYMGNNPLAIPVTSRDYFDNFQSSCYGNGELSGTSSGSISLLDSFAPYQSVPTTANSIVLQWVRVRSYPPDGIMPSVQVGGINYLLSTNTIVYDLSGNGNNGFARNVSFPNSLAEIPKAGFAPSSFSGNTQEINITNIPLTSSLHTSPSNAVLSISLWMWLNNTQTAESSNSATLIGTKGTSCGYRMWFNSPNSIAASDNCGQSIGLNYLFKLGVWYNLAMALNKTGYGSYYVDGLPVSESNSLPWQGGGTWNSLCIGSDCGSSFFKGSIFNVQLYNTTLNNTQVYQLYMSEMDQKNTTTSFTLLH